MILGETVGPASLRLDLPRLLVLYLTLLLVDDLLKVHVLVDGYILIILLRHIVWHNL